MKYKVVRYKVEVKYSGSIFEYKPEDLKAMATAKMERTGNFTPEISYIADDEVALAIDEDFIDIVYYDSNHIAIVLWSEVHDFAEED